MDCNAIPKPPANFVFSSRRPTRHQRVKCHEAISRLRFLHRNKLDIVQTDVMDDPTLQRSKNAICEKCNYNEAVFFQADEVWPKRRMDRKRFLVHACHGRCVAYAPNGLRANAERMLPRGLARSGEIAVSSLSAASCCACSCHVI